MPAPAVLLIALSAVARAHPVGGQFPSHVMELQLTPTGLELTYSARIPTHEVLAEVKAEQADAPTVLEAFSDRKLDELRDNVRVTLDGQPARWERVPADAPAARGNSRYLFFDQELRLDFPAGPPRELALSNGNYPDETSSFRVELWVDPALWLEQTSMVELEEGRVTRTWHARPRMDEPARELTLRVAPPETAWKGWMRDLARTRPAAPRPPQHALVRAPGAALRDGELPPEGVAALLAGAGLAGLGVGGARGGGRVALGVLLGVAGLLALVASAHWALPLAMAASAGVGWWPGRRAGPRAAWLAWPALLLSLGLLGLVAS